MHQMGALGAEFGGTEGAGEFQELESGVVGVRFDCAGLAPGCEWFLHEVFGSAVRLLRLFLWFSGTDL
jgi:hypothetical protein